MHDLGVTLIWAAAQVTVVAGAGTAMAAWPVRRGPAAAAPLTVGALLAVVVLVPLALLPLPTWWSWPLPADPQPAASVTLVLTDDAMLCGECRQRRRR